MTTPSVDIIVPVWNQPFEARACLVSIINTTDSARLIIVNNGCNRDTELLLEEFCDPLGERVLYMTMERNIGFVPAINRALLRSTADWAMVIRPNGIARDGWLQALLPLTGHEQAGIISPLCSTETGLPRHLAAAHCSQLETCQLSFAGVLLSRAMREKIGYFDEDLDGATWCLRDYQQRAAAQHYLTYFAPKAVLQSSPPQVFGSEERRRERALASQQACQARWGTPQQYAIYFPKQTEDGHLENALKLVLTAARRGDHFTLLLHHRQYQQAVKRGYRCLHTAIELVGLARFTANHDLHKRLASLVRAVPTLNMVKGVDGIPVPGYADALSLPAITQRAPESSSCMI